MIPFRFSKAFLERFGIAVGTWWDSAFKKSTILYPARGAGYLDIRKVFQVTAEGEASLKALCDEAGWSGTALLDPDSTMYRIMLFVTQRLSYVPDASGYGKVEFWADPYTIWTKKKDDCDGFAVLMAYLGWISGIPRYRLKVVGGDVRIESGENQGNTGHAYCLYLKEKDNRWYTCEGSFYPAEARERWRNDIPHQGAARYGKFWWTSTDEQSWAQHDLTIKNGVKI